MTACGWFYLAGRHVRLGSRVAGRDGRPSLGDAHAPATSPPMPRRHRPQRVHRAVGQWPVHPTGRRGLWNARSVDPRLGCYTVREEGPETFSGDAMVVICPTRSVPEEFRARLEQYVEQGGKLLVIDSPENTDSTANSLLWPFRLSIRHDRAWKGKLSTSRNCPP